MQIKDLITALAIPAVVLSAAIPQDPEIPAWDEGSENGMYLLEFTFTAKCFGSTITFSTIR